MCFFLKKLYELDYFIHFIRFLIDYLYFFLKIFFEFYVKEINEFVNLRKFINIFLYILKKNDNFYFY